MEANTKIVVRSPVDSIIWRWSFILVTAFLLEATFVARQTVSAQSTRPRSVDSESIEEIGIRLTDKIVELHREGRPDDALKAALEAVSFNRINLGQEHLTYLTSIINLASVYSSKGEYKKAELLYKDSHEQIAELFGESHPSSLASLNNLATLYLELGRFEESESLYDKYIKISQHIFKEDSDIILIVKNNMAQLYESMGRYEEALKVAAQILKIRNTRNGPNHPNTIISLGTLGLLYTSMGEYSKAESLFEKAYDASMGELGEEHPITLTSINNLATIYNYTGKYRKSEFLHIQSLKASEELLGDEHPDTIISLLNMATYYYDTGNYLKAEKISEQALEISRRVLGNEHPHTFVAISQLGVTLEALGRYSEAESHYIQAVSLSSQYLGESHPSTLGFLNNLAANNEQTGRFAESVKIFENIYSKSEQLLGSDHPNTLTRMSNLASAYVSIQRYDQAEFLHKESLKLKIKILGENHQDTLVGINNLAHLYYETGRYVESEKLFLQVTQSRRNFLGEEHPSTLVASSNLAALYEEMKRTNDAEKLYKKVTKFRRKILGDRHPDTQSSLNKLARFQIAQGKIDDAIDSLAISIQSSQFWSEREADYASTSWKRKAALDRGSAAFDYSLALAARHPSKKTAYLAASSLLKRKGIRGELELELIKFIKSAADENTKTLVADYLVSRRKLSASYQFAVKGQDYSNIKLVQKMVDEIEHKLVLSSAYYRKVESTRNISVQTIQENLPKNSVAIEYVQFTPINFVDAFWSEKDHYGAIIYRHGVGPDFVDLGSIDLVRDAILEMSETMGAGDSGFISAHFLYDRLVEPLSDYINGFGSVYLSPAGALGLIPFEELLTPEGRPLSKNGFDVLYIASVRSLVRQRQNPKNNTLIAFGGIDFNASLASRMDAIQTLSSGFLSKQKNSWANYAETDFYGTNIVTPAISHQFRPLVHTADELNAIDKIWRKVQGSAYIAYTGKAASETNLIGIDRNPRVLHFATHGFVVKSAVTDNFDRLALQSGLALAGANVSTGNMHVNDDGIVSGFELETLPLDYTELVVVSACDTSQGAVDYNEGVYSLVRAFRLAGAGAVLSTLRAVDDKITSLFISDFYRSWISSHEKKLADVLTEVKGRWANSNDPDYL